jgi:diguanylate cyclase (GGDEF)-like protein/PAS domain S-box-containing protein
MTVGVASGIVVDFFRVKTSISISDLFIFLVILSFDGETAVLLAMAEGFVSSLRVTRKLPTMLFNAGAMSLTTYVTVICLRGMFGPIDATSQGDYSFRFVMLIAAMAFIQYGVNSSLIATGAALRENHSPWRIWRRHYLWTSITYLACASAAGVTTRLITEHGFLAFIGIIPIIAILYFTYITYVKNVESSAARAESQMRFHKAFDNAPIGMALVAAEGRWLQVNQSLCKILGYSEEELLQTSFEALAHPHDREVFLNGVKQTLEGKLLVCQMESRFLHKLGHDVCVLVAVSPLTDQPRDGSQLILQIQDITDRKTAENQLLRAAYHDDLTELPNRAWFLDQLKTALARAKLKGDHLFAVLFLDLDRFKVINDSLGHLTGDKLLIEIGNRLRNSVGRENSVARLGGDEFTILLNNIKSPSEAADLALEIQQQVSSPLRLSDYETSTTASIGIAIYEPGYNYAEELLRDADTAMYQAKSLGKARHVMFNKNMHTQALTRLQLETDLRRAIERNELFLQYQPIVSLSTGRLTGFEALVRWQHPDQGLIMPKAFIGLAEEMGLIVPLGSWVLNEACTQMQRWLTQFAPTQPLSISVNLSSKQFVLPNRLSESVQQTLDSTGLDPRILTLEITESAFMQNFEIAGDILTELRASGVRLSIDDFGTGYSSLSYLHRLRIDTLKIDRSFVNRINRNNGNNEILRTIVALGHNLGIGVIAEGVESREQLSLLQELKCDEAQGYLFSRPVDAEIAAGFIRLSLDRTSPLAWFEDSSLDATDMEVINDYSM